MYYISDLDEITQSLFYNLITYVLQKKPPVIKLAADDTREQKPLNFITQSAHCGLCSPTIL
jgi:hypothetical protein